MDGGADISKIIGIIMENPDIIEKIKSLASTNENGKATEEASAISNESTQRTLTEAIENNTEQLNEASTVKPTVNTKKRRHDLLCAIKPYVSKERGRAIDTMLSVIDVLDIMKAR